MATTAAVLERLFQEYADSMEIKKILVEAAIPIASHNQLATKEYVDAHAGTGGVAVVDSLTSSQIADALSANQGRVLKGLVDGKMNADAISILDVLTSTDTHNGLSANQGRILKGLIDNLPSHINLDNYQLRSEKNQNSGYAGLDAHGRLFPSQMPPSGAVPHHVFTSQNDMLAGGAPIIQGELILVIGDPDHDKDGEYVALQDAPTSLTHYHHLGYPVRTHRHDDMDIDVTSGGVNETLHAALEANVLSVADAKKAGTDAMAKTVINVNSILNNESRILDTEDETTLNTEEIARNKIHNALSHRDAADVHPRSSITDVEKVFTDRLPGLHENGFLEEFTGDLNTLKRNGEWFVDAHNVTNHPGTANGVLVVRMKDVNNGVQTILPFSGVYWKVRQWKRVLYQGAWSSSWYEHGMMSQVKITQAAYTALATKDENTLYLIVG